jgi:plasmid stability protein
MGQLLVRKLDDDVKRRLQERAKRHGVSMEQEARSILRAELLRADADEHGLGSTIAALFRNIPDNDEPFERKLNEPLRPVNFDE